MTFLCVLHAPAKLSWPKYLAKKSKLRFILLLTSLCVNMCILNLMYFTHAQIQYVNENLLENLYFKAGSAFERYLVYIQSGTDRDLNE